MDTGTIAVETTLIANASLVKRLAKSRGEKELEPAFGSKIEQVAWPAARNDQTTDKTFVSTTTLGATRSLIPLLADFFYDLGYFPIDLVRIPVGIARSYPLDCVPKASLDFC